MNIISIAKWELVKRTSRHSNIFLAYIVLLLAELYLLGICDPRLNPTDDGAIFWLSFIVPILLLCVATYIMIILPTLTVVTEIRGSNRFLEEMRECSFMPNAVLRIILNILLVSLGYGLLLLVTEYSIKTDSSNVNILDIVPLSYIKFLSYTAIVSPTLAMFSIIAGSSIPRLKSLSSILAIALYFALGGGVLWMGSLPIPTVAISIIQCMVIIFLFLAACWLHDNKCEVRV